MNKTLLRGLTDDAQDALRATEAFRVMRVETRWVQERYEAFRKEMNLSKSECDQLLYEKTFARNADGPSCAQRIRFWRTGRYYPKNRVTCKSFAKALGLSASEETHCIQHWYDRSDRTFRRADLHDTLYLRRVAVMNELGEEFLQKLTPAELRTLCAPGTRPQQNILHVYCSKVSELVSAQIGPKDGLSETSRTDDATYADRFSEEMRLLGEISRTTMLRHLLVMSAPFISVELLNTRLSLLGYRPLSQNNSDRNGNALDLVVLRVLERYERDCCGQAPAACDLWLKEAWRWMDGYFVAHDAPGLCVFRFKHLNSRLNVRVG